MAIPIKDASLVPWANNFAARIAEAGNPYSIPAGQVAEMATLAAAFVESYRTLMTARAEGTRAESQTAGKETKKSALLALGRELYASIAASTSISDAEKVSVGVHVRPEKYSRVPAPTDQPAMGVVSVYIRTVTVRIYDRANGTLRGKPSGAIGAKIYTFVGEEYPTDAAQWDYRGDATKGKFAIPFPPSVPNGAQVWVRAAWYNRKGEIGPTSAPISTNIQGGGANIPAKVKMAA